MVSLMSVLGIVLALVFTTYSLADNDQQLSTVETQRKRAFAAAEAGVQNYLFHLVQDNDYWLNCQDVPTPNAVNQRWDGTGADTRDRWMTVPGEPRARFAIELLPANGRSACVEDDVVSMLDTSSSTFRIRSTGVSGPSRRSIVATFRRRGFLDFIYYTDFETQDPAAYVLNTAGLPTRDNSAGAGRNVMQWATDTCGQTYYPGDAPAPANRLPAAQEFEGSGAGRGIQLAAGWTTLRHNCREINFAGPPAIPSPDVIRGPLHTNDTILVCGQPRFGRTLQDAIEVSGPRRPLTPAEQDGTAPAGWRANPTCSSSRPQVNFTSTGPSVNPALGLWRPNSAPLNLPPSNSSLRRDTEDRYRFVGALRLELDGANMRVWGRDEDGQTYCGATIPIPADGVIYASNSTGVTALRSPACYTPASFVCGYTYNPLYPYRLPAFGPGGTVQPIPEGCGNVTVLGEYSVNLTIGAESDIIINGNLTERDGSNALLGLISNNFVRVFHDTTNQYNSATNRPFASLTGGTFAAGTHSIRYTCDTAAGSPTNSSDDNMYIDAAILSLSHSFTVDNWFCGGLIGTLNVRGAIAQKYRGVVGSIGQSGFVKNYSYDDRLRYRTPPKFLDPVQAAWQVQLFTEQVPAT